MESVDINTCEFCGVSLNNWYVQVGSNVFCSVKCYQSFKKRKIDDLQSKKTRFTKNMIEN